MAYKIAIARENYKVFSGVTVFFYRILFVDNLWRTFCSILKKRFDIKYKDESFRRSCFSEEYLKENTTEIYEKIGNSCAIIFSEEKSRYFIVLIEDSVYKRVVFGMDGNYRETLGNMSMLKNYFILIKAPNS